MLHVVVLSGDNAGTPFLKLGSDLHTGNNLMTTGLNGFIMKMPSYATIEGFLAHNKSLVNGIIFVF